MMNFRIIMSLNDQNKYRNEMNNLANISLLFFFNNWEGQNGQTIAN